MKYLLILTYSTEYFNDYVYEHSKHTHKHFPESYHRRERPQVSFLSRQKYACRDKSMLVETKVCLSRQNFCRDKNVFVETNTCFETKMTLVVAPANDRRGRGRRTISGRQYVTQGKPCDHLWLCRSFAFHFVRDKTRILFNTDPTAETNVFALKAWSSSECSNACFVNCQEFLPGPNFYPPPSLSLSASLFLYLSVCLSVSVSLCFSLTVSFSLSISISLPVSVCLSVCLSLQIHSLFLNAIAVSRVGSGNKRGRPAHRN